MLLKVYFHWWKSDNGGTKTLFSHWSLLPNFSLKKKRGGGNTLFTVKLAVATQARNILSYIKTITAISVLKKKLLYKHIRQWKEQISTFHKWRCKTHLVRLIHRVWTRSCKLPLNPSSQDLFETQKEHQCIKYVSMIQQTLSKQNLKKCLLNYTMFSIPSMPGCLSTETGDNAEDEGVLALPGIWASCKGAAEHSEETLELGRGPVGLIILSNACAKTKTKKTQTNKKWLDFTILQLNTFTLRCNTDLFFFAKTVDNLVSCEKWMFKLLLRRKSKLLDFQPLHLSNSLPTYKETCSKSSLLLQWLQWTI